MVIEQDIGPPASRVARLLRFFIISHFVFLQADHPWTRWWVTVPGPPFFWCPGGSTRRGFMSRRFISRIIFFLDLGLNIKKILDCTIACNWFFVQCHENRARFFFRFIAFVAHSINAMPNITCTFFSHDHHRIKKINQERPDRNTWYLIFSRRDDATF